MNRELRYEVREVTPSSLHDGRIWEVVVQPEGIQYRVTATGRQLTSVPPGRQSHDGDCTDEEIQAGIRHAIEGDLVSPPEKVAGGSYTVDLTASDLYDANGF